MTGFVDQRGTRALVAVPPQLRRQFFPPALASQLEKLVAVTYRDTAELPTGACDAEILVTSWGVTPLTEDTLERFRDLRLVAHTGASVKPFVTDAVFLRDITVTQAGAGMARSVAEVALTFTLCLLHQIHQFDNALRSGRPWREAQQTPMRHEFAGTRIGVVGASRTGRSYIELAGALGARIAVSDPYLDEGGARRLGVDRLGLDELMAWSRIVVVHAPALPETHHLIGRRQLALMPDGAGLVNTARSWLIDEAALLDELRTRRLCAALDVFDAEPLPQDHPLRGLPNVLLTPHQAAATVECRTRQGQIVIDEISRYVTGKMLQHAVSANDLKRMG